MKKLFRGKRKNDAGLKEEIRFWITEYEHLQKHYEDLLKKLTLSERAFMLFALRKCYCFGNKEMTQKLADGVVRKYIQQAKQAAGIVLEEDRHILVSKTPYRHN